MIAPTTIRVWRYSFVREKDGRVQFYDTNPVDLPYEQYEKFSWDKPIRMDFGSLNQISFFFSTEEECNAFGQGVAMMFDFEKKWTDMIIRTIRLGNTLKNMEKVNG